MPDLLAVVITFWCVHQPRKMGIGTAWALGLVMDAANGTLFGQHALAYAALAYAAQSLHRRILRFPLWQQALHVLVLLAASQLLMLWCDSPPAEPTRGSPTSWGASWPRCCGRS